MAKLPINLGLAAMALGATLLGGCNSENQAGGTGVGSPTKGTVTVAMVASDTVPVLGKTSGTGNKYAAKIAAFGSSNLSAMSGTRNPDGSFEIRDASGTVFTVRNGWVNLRHIRFKLPEGLNCTDADGTACENSEARIEGPWVSDLMTGMWTPDPGTIALPTGEYRHLSVRMESQERTDSNAPDLNRHSLVFSGTFAFKGRADRPFTIALDFDEDVSFESTSGFSVATGDNQVTIALNIGEWLSQVDLKACLEDEDLPLDASGGFSLDKDSKCKMEESLKKAVKGSGKVHGEHKSEKD